MNEYIKLIIFLFYLNKTIKIYENKMNNELIHLIKNVCKLFNKFRNANT